MTETLNFTSLFSSDFQLDEGMKMLGMPKEGTPLRFCILDPGVVGWLYWNTEKRTIKSPTAFKSTPGIQEGATTKQFAMMPVYNLADGSVSMFEMTAKGLLKFVMDIQKDGDFNLLDMSCGVKVTAKGSGMTVKYEYTVAQLAPMNGTKEEKEAALAAKVVEIQAAYSQSDYFDGSWKQKVFAPQTESLTDKLKAATVNAADEM